MQATCQSFEAKSSHVTLSYCFSLVSMFFLCAHLHIKKVPSNRSKSTKNGTNIIGNQCCSRSSTWACPTCLRLVGLLGLWRMLAVLQPSTRWPAFMTSGAYSLCPLKNKMQQNTTSQICGALLSCINVDWLSWEHLHLVHHGSSKHDLMNYQYLCRAFCRIVSPKTQSVCFFFGPSNSGTHFRATSGPLSWVISALVEVLQTNSTLAEAPPSPGEKSWTWQSALKP